MILKSFGPPWIGEMLLRPACHTHKSHLFHKLILGPQSATSRHFNTLGEINLFGFRKTKSKAQVMTVSAPLPSVCPYIIMMRIVRNRSPTFSGIIIIFFKWKICTAHIPLCLGVSGVSLLHIRYPAWCLIFSNWLSVK